MSTSPDAGLPTPVRKAPSVAGRYLFFFLLGLVLGIVAIVMLLRTLDSRKTWRDHYPQATMQLLSAQSAQLREKITANRCGPSDLLPHLQSLRSLGNDFEPAFPSLQDDPRFTQHAADFRATIDAALASPPLTCAAATAVTEQVGEACKACPQDFR